MLRYIVFFLTLQTALSFGQLTTSGIVGKLKDSNGSAIPAAKVQLTYTPTHHVQTILSEEDGSFVFYQLRPGGPYMLEVSLIGFEKVSLDSFQLLLGKEHEISLVLKEKTNNLKTVEVKGNRNEKDGVGENISGEMIQDVPTLSNSMKDITKLSPYGNGNSIAGSNYRFNNISIDGASNNDVLGFQEPASGAGGSTAAGTPGALSGTSPISFEVIDQVQLDISPYSVKYGNFTGANLNVVTKGGKNKVEGSAYGFYRGQFLTGKSVDEEREKIESFLDYRAGASISGPILKNKLFYFVNYERSFQRTPIGFLPGSPDANIDRITLDRIEDTLINRYGYDPGLYTSLSREIISDKAFVRLDYQINSKNALSVRHNFVKASADQLENGQNFFKFSTQGFTHNSTTNSTVAELKSTLKKGHFNKLVVGFNNVSDFRGYEGDPFPHIQIKHNIVNTIYAGTYREASIYGLNLNTFQLNDNYSIFKKNHHITIGTNNDIYGIEYRFLTAWNGRWEYRSVDDFFNDRPARIRGVYNYTDNSFEYNRDNPSADFYVILSSLYAEDEWSIGKRFKLLYGLRLDAQFHPASINQIDELKNTPELAQYTNSFGGIPDLNPRLGFKYKLGKKQRSKLSGGLGLFTGRIPFAWYAYAHYISGNNYGNIDIRPGGDVQPLTTDLSELASSQPGLTEINLVDNNFKLPRDLKMSLNYTVNIKKWEITFEGIFSKSLQAIQFKSLNLKDSTANLVGADNRSYYLGSGADKKVNPNFTNVFLLTNTNKGYRYNLSVRLAGELLPNLHLMSGYAYGVSKDVSNGVRNSMAANFSWNQAIDSNNPGLSHSNFDLRHRFTSTLSFTPKIGKHQSKIILFGNVQSGSPFSFTVEGDLNKDGSSNNDLIYVPANASEINFEPIVGENGAIIATADQQWQSFDSYISGNKYLSSQRGNYVERNGARTPWNYQVDLRLEQRFNLPKDQSLTVSLTILNFTNLLYYKWGWQKFVPNNQNQSYQVLKLDRIENGEAYYQFEDPNSDPWQVDFINSRWQAQLGLRYTF
ncbi:MAG: carboxypeptidase regulatory-like domain-containing protein [Flavobacteriales bacterium]|nr:carboxypeptidase regulatory-like domain-containing protein [Flavobacteriales bacterium]